MHRDAADAALNASAIEGRAELRVDRAHEGTSGELGGMPGQGTTYFSRASIHEMLTSCSSEPCLACAGSRPHPSVIRPRVPRCSANPRTPYFGVPLFAVPQSRGCTASTCLFPPWYRPALCRLIGLISAQRDYPKKNREAPRIYPIPSSTAIFHRDGRIRRSAGSFCPTVARAFPAYSV